MYLKLLESRREGKKIKHIQLANLSGVTQNRPDRLKPLIEDLNKTLVFFNGIVTYSPPWCRHLKASYLMALENSFKIEQRCRDQVFRELLLQEEKGRHKKSFDETLFNELIYSKSLQPANTPGLVGWIENNGVFLLSTSGFLLGNIPMDSEDVEKNAELLSNLNIQGNRPEFFLGNACELLYKTFRLIRNKNRSLTISELYIFDQHAEWWGTPDSKLDRMLFLGTGAAAGGDMAKVVMSSVISIMAHIDYVNWRLERVTGDATKGQGLSCTYFISSVFKQLFDDIQAKHVV